MFKRFFLWCRLLKLECECRKLRRQRDCLHKYSYDLIPTFTYLPKDLIKVLDEIESEDGSPVKAQ